MGYGQWVQVIIRNKSAKTLTIKDPSSYWGKFYAYPEKSNEVSSASLNDNTIGAGMEWNCASCGRSDASSGTEGTFWLFDGSENVGKIYWSCPWSGSNNFTAQPTDANRWVLGATVWSSSGALGTITVTAVYIGN